MEKFVTKNNADFRKSGWDQGNIFTFSEGSVYSKKASLFSNFGGCEPLYFYPKIKVKTLTKTVPFSPKTTEPTKG